MLCELKYKSCLRPGLYSYVIEAPQMASKAQPGQFIHVLCGGASYLRRPISICDVIDGRLLRFVFEVRGKGTEALSGAVPGDKLDILGPLGNGFELMPVNAPEGSVILVGGGIGIFPLLCLAKRLPVKPEVMLGFRSSEAAVMTDEFAAAAKALYVATDDGSLGRRGFVTDILRGRISGGGSVSRVYVCGPVPMMKIAADIAAEYGVMCQISMEERMGCGVGACVTCTCTMKDGSRKRVCKDGPVFYASEVEING